MKIRKLLATHAGDGQYVDLIRSACDQTNPDRICAAVAYATHGGVAELNAALQELPGWKTASKRWLVGIDYCRSDPVALAHLAGLPRSRVRIFDGGFVSGRTGCVPRYSYHPHQSPHFKYQMTPNIPRYTRCSISIRPNASINARTRYSGQFGTCSYSINP